MPAKTSEVTGHRHKDVVRLQLGLSVPDVEGLLFSVWGMVLCTKFQTAVWAQLLHACHAVLSVMTCELMESLSRVMVTRQCIHSSRSGTRSSAHPSRSPTRSQVEHYGGLFEQETCARASAIQLWNDAHPDGPCAAICEDPVDQMPKNGGNLKGSELQTPRAHPKRRGRKPPECSSKPLCATLSMHASRRIRCVHVVWQT